MHMIPQSVEDFFHTAQDYCRWAEQGPSAQENEVYSALKLVSTLYQQALLLPEVEPENDVKPYEALTKINSRTIYERFSKLPFQHYFELFHPITETPEEAVTGDIADDLMDIYIDLKQGILIYERGSAVDAVFQWKITFGFHWGRHATSALRALHSYETEVRDDDE